MDFNSTSKRFALERNAIRQKYSNKKQLLIMEHKAQIFELNVKMNQEILEIDKRFDAALLQYQRERDENKKELKNQL